MIVVDKPAGLLSVPLERQEHADSVVDQLVTHLRSQGKRKPLVVHRIDRDTSGLVVFAKTTAAQHALREQFKRQTVERVYRAVVYGHPNPPSGVWRDRLVWDRKALIQKATHPRDREGKDAVCRYETLETFATTSCIEVRLEMGSSEPIIMVVMPRRYERLEDAELGCTYMIGVRIVRMDEADRMRYLSFFNEGLENRAA